MLLGESSWYVILFICNVISKSTHFFSDENQLSIRLVLFEFNTEVLLLTFDLLDLYNMTHKLSCKNECITKTYSHLNYASAVSYTSLLDFKSLDPPFFILTSQQCLSHTSWENWGIIHGCCAGWQEPRNFRNLGSWAEIFGLVSRVFCGNFTYNLRR